ncbi:MAG: beta-lactamase [Bacteroidetes bacterium]|nr:MAG: beta-lactamase [Bacteroidota bacterium]
MKRFKKFLKWFAIVLVVLNLLIIVTGNTHLYKGIWNTYLKGRSGPSVEEYAIFNNRVVKAGTPQEWPRAADFNKKSIPAKPLADMTAIETGAFLVIKNDSIRFEQYWNGFADSSHTNSFSVAKTIVSVLVGCAIREGKIQSIDQPVGDFLPEFKTGENAKLKIRHLLTMSSGIDFDEDYVSPFAYPAKAYYGGDLRKLTMKYKVTEEPGKTFRYLSGNTQLLSFILQKATGKKLGDYAAEQLWQPLGAERPAYWSLDHAEGEEKAYCCFNSNARDFARIGKLYLDSGRWNGKQIVPEEYALQSIQAADLLTVSGQKNATYGLAWWLINDYKGHRVFYARGILGQYIFAIPDEDMLIVRLGRKRVKQEGDDHPTDIWYYLDAALEMYAGK